MAQNERRGAPEPDQTLRLLPSRDGWAGRSMGNELGSLDVRLGERFTFERRPHRWADHLFLTLVAAVAVTGLLWKPIRRSTPPAR